MSEPLYQRLPTPCDLNTISLIEAAQGLTPSKVYMLHVGGGRAYWDGKQVARLAQDQDNPLSPYINLCPDPELHEEEWYLEDEQGNKFGSPGAMG